MPATQLINKKTVGFYVIGLALLIFAVYRYTELTEVVDLFRQIHPFWLTVAVLLQAGTYVCTGSLYQTLLRLYQHPQVIKLRELLRTSVVIVFLNQAIPTAGGSGGAFFLRRLGKNGVPSGEALSMVLLEKITYYIAHLLALVVGFVLFSLVTNAKLSALHISVGILGVAAYTVFLTLLFIFSGRSPVTYLSHRLAKIKWLRRLLERFDISLSEIKSGEWHSPWVMLRRHTFGISAPVLWQLGIVLVDASTIYAVFHGFGVQVAWITVVFCFALTMAVSSVSVFPGALAFFEGSMTLFYTALGVELHTALITTLVYRVLSFWLPMPVGLIMYRRLQKDDTSSGEKTT